MVREVLTSFASLSSSQIVAEIGKLMIEEIPLDVTEPGMPRRQYDGEFSKQS